MGKMAPVHDEVFHVIIHGAEMNQSHAEVLITEIVSESLRYLINGN